LFLVGIKGRKKIVAGFGLRVTGWKSDWWRLIEIDGRRFWILDFGFWILDSGYSILFFLNAKGAKDLHHFATFVFRQLSEIRV